LHDEIPLPKLKQENDLPMSLSHDSAPEPSSHEDVAETVLVSTHPSTPFKDSFEFEECEESNSATKFNEHHNFHESEAICLQESCE